MTESKVKVIRQGRLFDIRQHDENDQLAIGYSREGQTVIIFMLNEGVSVEEAEGLFEHLEKTVHSAVTLL